MGKDYSSAMDNPLGQRLRELPGPLLLTGHTGFKGTWMTFLLEHLNVPLVGYSLPAAKNSLYDRADRVGAIPEVFADIRDYETLEKFVDLQKPSTIIHMAAQPLVLKSYESPRETFDVNVMGTVNMLDIAFKKEFVKAIIVVTTDKVYRNNNSGRAFVEDDPLEGKDPYSASKVGTESVVAAWQQLAKVSGGPSVASARGGNVIGGGDFGIDRLIPDLVRGVLDGRQTVIRNPKSTRPWQHVLDPLWGYVKLLESIYSGLQIASLNFGPGGSALSVERVVEIGKTQWEKIEVRLEPELDKVNEFHLMEAKELDLDVSQAKKMINWESIITQEEAIRATFNWWRCHLTESKSAEFLVKTEVEKFANLQMRLRIES